MKLLSVLILGLAIPGLAQSPLVGHLGIPQRSVSVYGQRTTYYEAGQGRVLILLSNLGWDGNFWFRNMPALAKHNHVIVLDILGQGGSAKPMIDYSMRTWTEWIAEFMRVKGIEKATVGGAVMGGALGVQFALDFPGMSEGIILAASNSGPGHPAVRPVPRISSSLVAIKHDLQESFYDKSLITDDFVRSRYESRLQANDGFVILKHLSDHRDPYTPSELAGLHVPALVVWCEQDEVTPVAWGKMYADSIAGSQFVVIQNCGHYPNLEKPEDFNAAVDRFMHSTTRSSAR